ncbi:GNAT family N-acetyltransferase [Rhizobium leguminosarum]|uniref:GNAT family N-acetyltransferase n=2 Tax=Rhizobium leguminosarum TaxID=384 RepID=UPI00102FB25D|nr:N-acetyltransferase [Rhizobium leguminosarum]TBG95590.1 N-acetyltransferase [Rhizobium leguminosarum]TBH27734.1 N-acetyltransferase [Rhizobium leguminosarum]TBH47789.1 N-acetyltransferase [Rhizobium leguminosarum]TBH63211.1 N-acetyltransferase [Rhizobium leguminosarum]
MRIGMSRNESLGQNALGAQRVVHEDVYAALSSVHSIYPGFERWFWGKVIPDLSGGRSIFLDWHGGDITGVIIAKRSYNERKLCTVWVDERYRDRGIASCLISEACEWLATDHPMITIPRSRLATFAGILRPGRFIQTQALDSYYRHGEAEFVFNGWLPPSGHSRLLNA